MKFNAFAAACAVFLLVVTPNFCSEADAGPGSGIRLWRDTTISPLIEASYTYDSNPGLYPEGEEIDDYFWDAVLALSLIKQNDKQSLSLRGWYQLRRYDLFKDLDDDTWQENIDWVYGDRRDLQLMLSQRFGILSDYEFTQSDTDAKNQSGDALLRLIETRTRRVSRTLNDIGAGLSHETDRTQIDGGVSYAAVAFEEEEGLFDWSELQGSVDFGYRATDKTVLALNGVLGQHTTDNSLKDTAWIKGKLGVRTEPTYKTSIRLGVGIESYTAEVDDSGMTVDTDVDRDVDIDTSQSDDTSLDTTRFHYDGKVVWSVTEKIDFQLFGRNEILPTSAFTANTKEVNQGSVGLVYRPKDNWTGSVGWSYRTDDYTRLIDGIDAFEELIGLQLRLVYDNKRRWLQIYAKARYEEFRSNIQDEYIQLRVTLGLNLKY